MTIIDGTSGSMPAGKCGFSSRNSPGCPALASMATRAPSHSLVAAIPSIVRIAFDGTTVAIAGVIEGQRSFLFRCSDLSPSSICPRGPLETCTLHDQKRLVSPARRCGNADPTLTGQRDDTAGAAFLRFVGTGGRRDGRCMSILDSRKPHAEKVLQRRPRQSFA